MNPLGKYGDGRTYDLPSNWEAISDEVAATAVRQTIAALGSDDALANVSRYYDRSSSYCGTLFLDVEPNISDRVEAADLYAVTTLSIELDARQGRLLLEDADVRAGVRRQLSGLAVDLPITDLEHGEGGSAETLARMYELHARFRDLLPGASTRWVTAAKLCARKRPLLFPVRDNLVCTYLGDGRQLRSGDGWPGDFSVDIQVYAYLMTHTEIRNALGELRVKLEDSKIRVDDNLRLLDSALWMAASRASREKV